MNPRTSPPMPGVRPAYVPRSKQPHYSQGLDRGLSILGRFSPEHHTLGIAELADMLGMSRATTHRYVVTLMALGFLEQCHNRKYRLGLKVTDIGMAALNCTDLRERSHPLLEELRFNSSFTVSLAVLDGPEILYVDRARSYRRGQDQIDLNIRLGSRLPAYCTAMGKVLLAYLPNAEQGKLVAKIKLVKRGPKKAITTKKALLAELDQVREVGMAVNDEELAADLVSFAVPVREENDDVIAAINMAAYTDMISLAELVDQMLPRMINAADRISAGLGAWRVGDAGW